MKIISLFVTLVLMQMSCFADGFYFCFKPSCTKTYLKFNQSQLISHLVKKHDCKKLSNNSVLTADKITLKVNKTETNHFLSSENNWFWYCTDEKKEIQEQYTRYLSYSKLKLEKKVAFHNFRQKYGKRIDFEKKVYNIIISKGKYTFRIKLCDCSYCLISNPDAGQIRATRFNVSSLGIEHNILRINWEGSTFSDYEMIKFSTIPKMAKQLGFTKIELFTFADGENYEIKL